MIQYVVSKSHTQGFLKHVGQQRPGMTTKILMLNGFLMTCSFANPCKDIVGIREALRRINTDSAN